MPTMLTGLFRSESGLDNDRPIDMEASLDKLEPSRNPNFEKISRCIGEKVAKGRTKYEYRRRDLTPNTCKVTVVDAAGQSHIEVDYYGRINGRVLLYNTRTHEMLLHSSDDVASDATVDILSYTHTTPGTAALRYATAIGDVINILPETHEEGEDFLAAWKTASVEDYDYIMQFARRSSDISDIAAAEDYWDPVGERNLANRYAMIELMRDLNLLFYLSQRTRETSSTTGTARRQTFGGLRQKITVNRQSLAPGVAITPQSIGEILRLTKYQGMASQTKLAMAGQNMISEVSSWPLGHIQTSPREKEWGYDIKRIITPHGNLDLAYDPALADENGLADIVAILDEAHIRQVYLQTMGMKVIKKVSSLSTKFRIVDGVTGTAGLDLRFDELHAWIDGIGK